MVSPVEASGGSEQESLVIVEFSSHEGAAWQAFPDAIDNMPPPDTWLAEQVVRFNKSKIYEPLIKLHGEEELLVHAFKMNDGRIWDCLNGWR